MGRHDKAISANKDGVLTLGAQLRLARQRAGISLKDMAQRLNYSTGYLSGLETGAFPLRQSIVDHYKRELARIKMASGSEEVVEMSRTQDQAWDVVIAGTTSALAHKDRRRLEIEIDEPIEHLCKRMGLNCYKPPRFARGDAEQQPDLPAEYNLIVHSKALIAYVGVNDNHTGLQLGWAHVTQIPIILLFESGNSTIADEYRQQQLAISGVVAFRSQDDLESQLSQTLFWLLSERNLKDAARQEAWTAELTDSKLRDLNDLRRRGIKLPMTLRPISAPDWINQDSPVAALERGELQHRAG